MTSDKKRQKMTITAMAEAMKALHLAANPHLQQHQSFGVGLVLTQRGQHFVVTARTSSDEGIVEDEVSGDDLAATSSEESYEAACAELLLVFQRRFEDFRQQKQAELDNILVQHRGVLRGARSKLKST